MAIMALSQNVTSTIVGNVRDSSGASISAASVMVTNEGTGIETKSKTGADGGIHRRRLALRTIHVRLEATGFRENLAKGITLLPNRTTRQDFSLEVGATAAVLNTESATIGNIMPSQQITTVPLTAGSSIA